jgi:hypothetical protein
MMNEIFLTGENQFIVVYLDDILIFSETWEEHLRHIRWTLEKLRENSLYAKLKKCEWGSQEVEYLGHIIRPGEVAMDPKKIKSIIDWPTPRNVKDVQAFMGLANFYRRFIFKFSQIAAPITDLTKEDIPFEWTNNVQNAFDKLKAAITSAPVLRLFNPEIEIRTEHDASTYAWAGVLSQKYEDNKWHPVAFESHKFSAAQKNYDIRNKEFVAITESLKKWRHYLYGRKFGIISDHESLTYIPTQPNLVPRQIRQIELLAEFDFEILYRPGKANTVADALSRRFDHQDPVNTSTLTSVVAEYFKGWAPYYEKDPNLKMAYQLARDYPEGAKEFEIVNQLLRRKGKLCVPEGLPRESLLREYHDAPLAGHPGIKKTYQAIKEEYWWPKMKSDIEEHIKRCDACQKNKARLQKMQGLLNPLHIPDRNWKDIAMDFAVELPKTGRGKDAIHVVIDRKSKQAHFVPAQTTDNAERTAQSFGKNIVRLHRIPESITSDRDPKFTSAFWQELFGILGTKIAMSSSKHPQTDGQSEKMMDIVKKYLRIFCNYSQTNWDEILWIAEFAYNSAVHSSTGVTPFQANYGFQPFTPISLLKYKTGTAAVSGVDKHLTIETEAIDYCQVTLNKIGFKTEPIGVSLRYNPYENIAHINMERAQQQYTMQANKHRKDTSFHEGDFTLISTKDLDMTSYSSRSSVKLSPRFIGPYQITKVITPVSYRLRLPGHVKLHPVFHVSQLVLYHPPKKPIASYTGFIPKLKNVPMVGVLDRKTQVGLTYYLVEWENGEKHWVPARNMENGHHLILRWEDSL